MIPEIEFRYSNIYDDSYRNYLWVQKRLKKEKRKYPSHREILNYIKKIEEVWDKIEKNVLKELSNISGLKWKEKKIICYVVGYANPFSDPLTIPIYIKDYDYFIDILIHELIHQIFTQEGNLDKSKKSWNYLFKKYKKETWNTKIHIPLHAIHSQIYLKFFNKNRMQKDISYVSGFKDYKRSWEIVLKETPDKIIKDFKRIIK